MFIPQNDLAKKICECLYFREFEISENVNETPHIQ